MAAIAALGLHMSTLTWLSLLQALALGMFALPLLAVHELLRPFCASAADVVLLLPHVVVAMATAITKLARRGGKPKFPEWTVTYELFQALAIALGERGGAHIVSPANVKGFRRVFDVLGTALMWRSCRDFGTVAEPFRYNGLEHIWLKPAASSSISTSSRRTADPVVVLYYHGGGYALCSPRFYTEFGNRLRAQVAAALAERHTAAGSTAPLPDVHLLLANYRKIPEHPFPVPVDDAVAMYDYLVKDKHIAPSQIVVAGDSAGGGLVIATLMRLRDAARPLPAAALTICPYVDMFAPIAPSEHCFISASMLTSIRAQCIDALARTDDASRCKSSDSVQPAALREAVTADADLDGLPPLLILAAEFDILHSQSLRLAASAKRHNVDVELDIHVRMPHVFCVLPPRALPQSAVGIERLAAFAAKKLVPTQS